jgi:hypothetical protein
MQTFSFLIITIINNKGSMVLAVLLGGMLLVFMAVFGYAAYGQDSNGDILSNFPISSRSVQFADVLLVLHLTFYIPNAFVIYRLFFLDCININVLALDKWPFVFWTLGLFAVLVVTMASVPRDDVNGAFAYTLDLTGDVPIGFSCFLLPAAIYLKVFDYERNNMWFMSVIICVYGTVLITVCPIVDTILFVKACLGDGCDNY